LLQKKNENEQKAATKKGKRSTNQEQQSTNARHATLYGGKERTEEENGNFFVRFSRSPRD
jgi:hypothetical protein